MAMAMTTPNDDDGPHDAHVLFEHDMYIFYTAYVYTSYYI